MSFPALIAVCTTGAAKSTSHVVMTMSAPRLKSLVAQVFAIAGLLPCVLHVMRRSLMLFDLLTRAMCVFAVARAGPSNGAIAPTPSYAQPMVTVFACSDAAVPPPTTATAATATASRASVALHTFFMSALLSVIPATMLPCL